MSQILAFAGVAAALTLTPGPDSLLVLRAAVSHGRGQALAAGLGVCTALAGWGCAAAFGLTAVLATAPLLYQALRWAGAAYLAYLGIRLLAGRPDGPLPAGGVPPPAGGPARWRLLGGRYLRGVITNASNPKIGVFYLSLLPQFIPAGGLVLRGSLLLAGVHVAESLAWFAVVALLASRLGRWLRHRRVRRWADRTAGAAFLAFAARLALER